MKVVILGTRGFPNVQGGVEKHCEFLSVNLVKLGCEVIVFARKPYIDKNIKEYLGVRLDTLPALQHKTLETLLHTFIGIFAALRYKPDILQIQGIGPAFFTPLARILGRKVVVTSHGSNYKHFKWGRTAKIFLKLGEYLGCKFANAVIAVSDTIAEDISRRYGRKAIVIYNGVNMPEIPETTETLKKFGLEKGKYILAVGRIVAGKGFDDLIKAFKIASGRNIGPSNDIQKWKLVIAGDADYEDKYSRKLKESAINTPGIVLTGFLSGQPLQELYGYAGLFVLPSYYEGLPISLLEAMSYGLMCLASDIEANQSISLPAENYFKAGDISQLAEKIKIFTKRSLSQEEKHKQIEMLQKKYDWNEIALKTLGVYRKVIGKYE